MSSHRVTWVGMLTLVLLQEQHRFPAGIGLARHKATSTQALRHGRTPVHRQMKWRRFQRLYDGGRS